MSADEERGPRGRAGSGPVRRRIPRIPWPAVPGARSDAEHEAPPEGDVSEVVTRATAARMVGIAESTLRRWVDRGLVELGPGGQWTLDAVNRARVVQRLRDRGRSLAGIEAVLERSGTALDYLAGVVELESEHLTTQQAARETGLETALVRRIFEALGYGEEERDQLGERDVALLRRIGEALDAGFPLVALLQLARVYGQALGRVADAEVRLFRLYVRDPVTRDAAATIEAADEVAELARTVVPLSDVIVRHVHRRSLQWFIEQDAVSVVEQALDEDSLLGLGRLRVAIAFADLSGYTRLTEEAGDEEAVDAVERFVAAVQTSLPRDARILKTIGDEVMVIADDPRALVDWAVGFQVLHAVEPRPRIGIHAGEVLFRDGDYFGREVNQAARVVARAAGGEVVTTRAIADVAGPHLAFEPIGEVRLKGFRDPTELFVARLARPPA